MSSLRELVAEATPSPWEYHHDSVSQFEVHVVVSGDQHIGRQFRKRDAPLVALAPEMALLLADTFELYGARMPADLLARFRELESHL